MKQGELLRGYRITTKPTNDGAGKCMWSFAEKDGREFFVKQFLELKRPRPESMGRPEAKRKMQQACDAFERRHRSVMERIDPDSLDAGNLVTAVDFFCEGTTYYKVTERIHAAELPAARRLTAIQKKALLRTLGDSVHLLHRLGVVHGDLKPANVLVEEHAGIYIAKLIDFDDAYVSGSPPERADIGGDIMYGAPEWLRYNQGDDSVGAKDLTTAADMFAIGLMTHQYLTGAEPGHGGVSAAEAVNTGVGLDIDLRLHPRLEELIRALTSADPAARPTIAEFLTALEDESRLELGPKRRRPTAALPRPTTVAPRPTATATDAGAADSPTDSSTSGRRRSRVRISGKTGAAAHAPTASGTAHPSGAAGPSATPTSHGAGTPPGTRTSPATEVDAPEKTAEPPAGERRSRLRINLRGGSRS